MKLKKDKALFYITYAICLLFVLFNIKEVWSIILYILSLATPFYVALVIAFILNIPMSKIEKLLAKKINKKGLLRGLSLTLTLVLAVLLLVLFSSFILPKLIESITLIVSNIISYTTSIVLMINKLLKNLDINYSVNMNSIQALINSNFDINNIISYLSNLLSTTGINLIIESIGIVGTFINGIASLMMGIYLLASKEIYIVQAKKLITFVFGYKRALKIIDIGIEANHYFNNFVSGQLLECCIFMSILYIVMRIFSLPFPELIAFVVAISSLVPMFGTFVGFFISFILVLAASPSQAILFVVCFICVQQFEGNVIYPHVVGDAVGISGLYVLLSLVIFGHLFGFVGLLIAVPSMAVIYAVGSRIINISLYKHHIDVKFGRINRIEDDEE